MKKILQIGTNGQVGWELLRSCSPLGELIGLDYPAVDLSDSAGLRELVKNTKPDIIINAAAYTNVDKAEIEPELARSINAIGPGVLAEEAKKINAVIVHYSTDYVFDGTRAVPISKQMSPIHSTSTARPSWKASRLCRQLVGHTSFCAPAGFTRYARVDLSLRCCSGRGSRTPCAWWMTKLADRLLRVCWRK